jgi:hypothetical protein
MKPTLTLTSLALLALAACSFERKNDKIVAELDTAEAKAQARQAGREIQAGAEQAGAAIDASKQELDVRAALALADDIDRSALNVSADQAAHSIRLAGSVPTLEQRTRAEAIAKEKAEGWTILNELVVAPPPGVSAPAPATMAPLIPTAPFPATATAPAPATASAP